MESTTNKFLNQLASSERYLDEDIYISQDFGTRSTQSETQIMTSASIKKFKIQYYVLRLLYPHLDVQYT